MNKDQAEEAIKLMDVLLEGYITLKKMSEWLCDREIDIKAHEVHEALRLIKKTLVVNGFGYSLNCTTGKFELD